MHKLLAKILSSDSPGVLPWHTSDDLCSQRNTNLVKFCDWIYDSHGKHHIAYMMNNGQYLTENMTYYTLHGAHNIDHVTQRTWAHGEEHLTWNMQLLTATSEHMAWNIWQNAWPKMYKYQSGNVMVKGIVFFFPHQKADREPVDPGAGSNKVVLHYIKALM